MVERIGARGTSLAQEAIQAALKRQAEARARIQAAAAEAQAGGLAAGQVAGQGSAASKASDFSTALSGGIQQLNSQVQAVDQLPAEFLTGGATDFHEIAARVKQSELTFRFAMEVRNKLIDAYREVMRMSV